MILKSVAVSLFFSRDRKKHRQIVYRHADQLLTAPYRQALDHLSPLAEQAPPIEDVEALVRLPSAPPTAGQLAGAAYLYGWQLAQKRDQRGK